MNNKKEEFYHILDLLYNAQAIALIESYPSKKNFQNGLGIGIRKIHIKKLDAINFSAGKFSFSEKATTICAIFFMSLV